jgi:ribonuclease HII
VDEVGRGSWAGPLVAAAVILPLDKPSALRRLREVRDSKVLVPFLRAQLYDVICHTSIAIGLGWVSHREIDREGIALSNKLALTRAVESLAVRPDALVIDHFRLPGCHLPQTSVSRADALSLSVASASIVAKVVRDRWMENIAPRFPSYGFEMHKGYGTLHHREALDKYGPCAIHRRCFEPIAVSTEDGMPRSK